jgi:hypothetical protein
MSASGFQTDMKSRIRSVTERSCNFYRAGCKSGGLAGARFVGSFFLAAAQLHEVFGGLPLVEQVSAPEHMPDFRMPLHASEPEQLQVLSPQLYELGESSSNTSAANAGDEEVTNNANPNQIRARCISYLPRDYEWFSRRRSVGPFCASRHVRHSWDGRRDVG